MSATTTVAMSEDDYLAACDENQGVCLHCGAIDDTDFYEPDARDRPCSNCDEHLVCGIEWALVAGAIDIT
jgi:hypothetical protein